MLRTNTIQLLHIVEEASSNYHYHLSVTGDNGKPALCGYYKTMHTNMRLNTWNGKPSHIPAGYCRACTEAAANMGIAVPEITEKTATFHR